MASADLVSIRAVVREVCGFDPGPLAPATCLEDIGLIGFDLCLYIGSLEDQFGIEFPLDLMSAMETVDDLLYFTTTKIDQR